MTNEEKLIEAILDSMADEDAYVSDRGDNKFIIDGWVDMSKVVAAVKAIGWKPPVDFSTQPVPGELIFFDDDPPLCAHSNTQVGIDELTAEQNQVCLDCGHRF